MTIQVVEIRSPNTSSFTNVTYTSYFEGTEQIVMNTYDYQYNYGSNGVTYLRKDPIKIMLDSISYELENGVIQVRAIEGYGFRKDGKIRARTSYYYNNPHTPHFKDLLPQIPDSFHNKARIFFDETLKKLSDELLKAKQKGLQLK